MLLVVPPGHRLAARKFVRPADLESEHLLLYRAGEESFFYRQFFARSVKRPPVTVVKLTEAILSMVRAGLGLGVAARWAIAGELSSGRLIGVRLGAQGFQREWVAATLDARGRAEPAYVNDFIELIAGAAMPSRFAARYTMPA
jgi:LysR family transcriptional regulator for metE and metH